MSKKISLAAQSRDLVQEKPKALRRAGFIPAEIYGPGQPNVHIKVVTREFEKVFADAGPTDLVDLSVDGKVYKVLIHDVDYLDGQKLIHASFLQVNMSEEVTVRIPFNFVGESPAVTDKNAMLNTIADEVEVECLPDALVHSLDVDLSLLKEYGDHITMADLNLPAGLKLMVSPEELIVSVNKPASVAEEVVPEAESPTKEDQKKDEAKK